MGEREGKIGERGEMGGEWEKESARGGGGGER